MYQCLVFFVLGAIITVIFIKILEWKRIAQQRHVYAEIGEERILPIQSIQEEGDEAVRPHRRSRRVIQGYTIRPRKLPCQHEETHWEIWRSWWELMCVHFYQVGNVVLTVQLVSSSHSRCKPIARSPALQPSFCQKCFENWDISLSLPNNCCVSFQTELTECKTFIFRLFFHSEPRSLFFTKTIDLCRITLQWANIKKWGRGSGGQFHTNHYILSTWVFRRVSSAAKCPSMLGVATRENSLLVDSSLKLNVPEETIKRERVKLSWLPPEAFSVMSLHLSNLQYKITLANHK